MYGSGWVVKVVSAHKFQPLLPLDEALDALEKYDPQQSKIVELRFFGGLTIEETAEVMKL
jgi:DNA-directed RNA polymerase specialized sigma24 family protein